ncbi:hypothetical protein M495_08035 [Serratia liquefaciens ATCC 27592]|nr:hypothetical protein M495_08035 [Serratia liquefaciens ATCC 27592]
MLAEYSIKNRVNPLNWPPSQRFIAENTGDLAEPVIVTSKAFPASGE